MKQLLTLLSLSVLFFFACSSSDNGNIESVVSKQMVKPFSDSLKADTFNVALAGNTPKNMSLTFTIHNYKGQEIYKQIIKGAELIGNYKKTLDLEGEKSQLKFLREEVSLFFEEENFLEPAVTEQEEPDQYSPDKDFYAELKKTGLNGFKYRLGNETKIYIAWSAKDQKIKIYYKCC
ncbi:hypothetical protein LPB86_12265 [Pedobacter sp. MC2016-14]|uniref:hypothetical protein n=1 Tax=Pedobacter sp. MC2016-14 TaxID=2897327 RepID=UPI001E6377A9|nr:hypothetical protein [Pedobacter sp. MC2016-14]MCD0489005.1 hypothetical protein [Pedobacter sp. MC2016-14]